jgi:hypothetical protein
MPDSPTMENPSMKRNLLSLAALGLFTVLAFGSKQSSFEDDDFDDLFGDDFEAELEAAMEEALADLEEEGAAGGGGGGSYADNVDACKGYVAKYNSLACLKAAGVQLEANDMCPSALNSSPLDMRDYYSCMADACKCNGNIPDLAGVSDCKMPSL